MEKLIAEYGVDIVVFSYSDIAHQNLMHLASRAVAAGADFWLLGAEHTQVASHLPVISVCAVRTGCGKSPVSRLVADRLHQLGRKPVVIRHPMPYGDLAAQAVQRFAVMEDLDRHQCTIEEREEYEPHIRQGTIVYAGVDYERILREAEREATSSCGMAATTTRRSTSRISRSWWSIRIGRATSWRTIPAKSTYAAPMS